MFLRSSLLLLSLATAAAADGNAYLLGGGLDADADSGLRASLLASVSFWPIRIFALCWTTKKASLLRSCRKAVLLAGLRMRHLKALARSSKSRSLPVFGLLGERPGHNNSKQIAFLMRERTTKGAIQ